MAVYLVRHAKAGRRSDWDGPDLVRPLSKAGRRQAEALVLTLGHLPLRRLLSSPYLRCAQTLEPLAAKVGVSVELDQMLAEGHDIDRMVGLLHEVGDDVVLCSHGDMIPGAIERLVGDGMRVKGTPDWRKGVTWVLDQHDGRFVSGRAVPPCG